MIVIEPAPRYDTVVVVVQDPLQAFDVAISDVVDGFRVAEREL